MKVFYADHFVLPLPEDHRFPMRKYSMLRERAEESGVCEMRVPEAVTDEEILRAHTLNYLTRQKAGEMTRKEMRRIGFPWSEEMVERCRRTCGGTLGACRAALSEGFAANLAGGTHHAFAHRGEGYCVFNDSAIAARAAQAEGIAERVLIVDTDVHQGNGTASILSDDSSVFTFSIHGAKNFPFHKEQSDLDAELPNGADDGEYLSALERGLGRALEAADFDLAIYLAGADAFEEDRLGRLSVSKAGLAERDRVVLESLRERGLPVVLTMAGGYCEEITHTVDIHFNSIMRAARMQDFANTDRARS